jgi:S-adenosylmethionine synthetase
MDVVISALPHEHVEPSVEIVERKGIGHPDTICDALAEQLSVALSRFYLERFGSILHHNVDKVLLRGGRATARFGGGDVLEPIEIYLAGRAISEVGGTRVPIEEIAVETTRSWLGRYLHALDPERHVRVHCLVRPGSLDLTELFARRPGAGAPLANDTSFGVGYAPLSELELLTLELEQRLNDPAFIARHPAHGEDVKIMAVRREAHVSLTVARAFIASHTPSLDEYFAGKEWLSSFVRDAAAKLCTHADVHVNAADSIDRSSVYLTVTGTSAESGDDGEVGRGNRANGLITPCRPMSLEALCGKNSVTHVGKLYNIVASTIAQNIVESVAGTRSAECYLVSRIGSAIDDPMLAQVRVAMEGDLPTKAIAEIVRTHLGELPGLWRRIVAGFERLY